MSPSELKTLIEQAAGWPAEDQQELADYVRVIEARRNGVYRVTDAERAAIVQGLTEANAGEFADKSELGASRSAV